ncbi:hypothetical protein [Photobacterium halotolerans]|uniref:hypothetical protein n=1 Tax=Photobacterium halotolerans TaxID=265726 RepID=UPI0003F7F3DE|nr:hypothetical protein [Photobacterium halotolerans]
MQSKWSIRIAVLLGLAALSNGVLMTIAPEPWYWMVPGVPDRGPFNQHFLRDIGMNYSLIGAAFIWGAIDTRHSLTLWLMPTAWLAGHAIFHVWEVLAGICGPEFLIIDFGGVTLPALLALWLIYTGYKKQAHE